MWHRIKSMVSVISLVIVASVVTAGAASAAGNGIDPLIELLLSKGTITRDEADVLNKRLSDQAASEVIAPDTTVAAGKPFEALPEKEVKPVIEVMREQNVLSNNEAAQITSRYGRKWSVEEEDDRIADPDDEIEYGRTTLPREVILGNLVMLRQQKLINEDEAERIKERFLHKLSLERIAGAIDENMRRDVQTQVAERIVPIPEWTKRIRFAGDFRLRYQGDFYDSSNGTFVKPDKTTELLNSTTDRQQLRIRARLNLVAKVNDEVEAGIGLATGSTSNPVSTNATLGDTLNKKTFLVDLAYLKWTPYSDLTLWGGRFANPWFGTDLVWDPDINFEGVAFSYQPKITSALTLFLTGGAFPIQEVELSSRDKWLYAGQLGLQYRSDEKLTARFAAAIYDFENVTGKANDPSLPGVNDWTAPQFQQKGNTLFDIDPASTIKTAYAAGFRELNFTGSLDFGFWDPLRVVLMGDYVNNIGYDSARVNSLTGSTVKKETEGYQFGITVGHPDTRAAGQWKLLLNYKYLQSDAVMDAFAESDFHLGGTNAKGWIVGGDYGLGKNVWLSSRWLTTNEISGPPLAIDVFQFNIIARF